ncbi:MAG: tRNA (guanosine(46)-N7)-methyltransferase TrmB [Gammaproteobacteria bacterium]|nr:tRNA (guanosine(46)-N7)-methyltransferase TrmB [Gammaproteobacteria bacterium]
MSEEIPFKREIKSYVRRVGRMTASQRRALEMFLPTYGVDYQNAVLNFSRLFEREAPVNIEIGFGMGENLIAVAKTHPSENFIGIEVHTPGVGHALHQLEENKLTNIRFIQHDAVEVLKHQIADHSLNSVSIFFPDPWHKKKHNKRRLINDEFCQLLATKIKKGGKVYMATDWENYAEQMLDVFSRNESFANQSPDGTYCERMDFRPITKFERRGQRLGHGTWDLIFKRI